MSETRLAPATTLPSSDITPSSMSPLGKMLSPPRSEQPTPPEPVVMLEPVVVCGEPPLPVGWPPAPPPPVVAQPGVLERGEDHRQRRRIGRDLLVERRWLGSVRRTAGNGHRTQRSFTTRGMECQRMEP